MAGSHEEASVVMEAMPVSVIDAPERSARPGTPDYFVALN
jgi:hypothetical protein